MDKLGLKKGKGNGTIEVENATLETLASSSGVIPPNTFVEKVGNATNATFTQTTAGLGTTGDTYCGDPLSAAFITDGQYLLHVHSRTTSDPYFYDRIILYQMSGTTPQQVAQLDITVEDSNYSYCGLSVFVKLSENKAMLIMEKSDSNDRFRMYVQIFTVSGTTITAGARYYWTSGTYDIGSIDTGYAKVLDSTRVIFASEHKGAGVIVYSGTTITSTGSFVSISATSGSASYPKIMRDEQTRQYYIAGGDGLLPITISGTVITVGADIDIGVSAPWRMPIDIYAGIYYLGTNSNYAVSRADGYIYKYDIATATQTVVSSIGSVLRDDMYGLIQHGVVIFPAPVSSNTIKFTFVDAATGDVIKTTNVSTRAVERHYWNDSTQNNLYALFFFGSENAVYEVTPVSNCILTGMTTTVKQPVNQIDGLTKTVCDTGGGEVWT